MISRAWDQNRFPPRVPGAPAPAKRPPMNTSACACTPSDFALLVKAEFRGLDTREQFAATLHLTAEQFMEQGVSSEDAAYFLLSAARSTLEEKTEFSANTLLAREYLQAALELL